MGGMWEEFESNVGRSEQPNYVKYAGETRKVVDIKEFPGGIKMYGIEDEPGHIDYINPKNCEIVESKPDVTLKVQNGKYRWKVKEILSEETIDQNTINKIYKNKEKVLDYLKANCFHKEEWVEKYWEIWTHYSLILPSVKWLKWKWFKWKKIEWFVPDRKVTMKEYKSNKKWIRNSSRSDDDRSTKIYLNIHKFLKELAVPHVINSPFNYDTRKFFRELFGENASDFEYWSNAYSGGECLLLDFYYRHTIFNYDENKVANLFLWLKVTELW